MMPGPRGERGEKTDPGGEERATGGTQQILRGRGGIGEGSTQEEVTFLQGLEECAGIWQGEEEEEGKDEGRGTR